MSWLSPRRCRVHASALALLSVLVLASAPLATAAPPSPTATASASPTPTATALSSPTPIPPQPTSMVGEPLVMLRVADHLYLHTPQPPDVLGMTVQVVSAKVVTVQITATLEAPAIPAGKRAFPMHVAISAQPNMDSVFLLPGSFTVPATTPIGSAVCVDFQWSVRGGSARATQSCTTVVGAPGSTPPTATAGPPEHTPVPMTAPCYLAALAALTRQGALYSQGGAQTDDPIDPKTRKPYPRTGPNSFDCSGLVWWAYAQAGISIGQTTLAQLNDGVALPCTLDDLRGADTRCWTLGDLIFLAYPGGRHVAIYVGQGLFMDCYNHRTGCVLHDVSRDSFYRAHFLEARRIVSGCEELTIDPGQPIPSPPVGDPEHDAICIPDGPHWTDDGVGYSRGCGPPVLPPNPDTATGTTLRQFVGIVGWLGDTGRLWPPGAAGVHLHLGLDVGTTTDMCRWPNQVANAPPGQPPPGGTQCMTTWADPMQFLPQANGDSLRAVAGTPIPVAPGQAGDPTYAGALIQLPPPGHPAGLLLPAHDPDQPGGTWWSPGNDDRAQNARCPLGGPATSDWLRWIVQLLFPWLFGC